MFNRSKRRSWLPLAILVLVLPCFINTSAFAQDPEDGFGAAPELIPLPGLPDEPWFLTPVTSVTRQESTVGRSPAAVFVITPEMIRRSGARSLPELLRMVPGLFVAKIDANKWSVSSRGFSGRFARKLLVQLDGRTLYTPLFGGVFWDVQDVLLEDIERIEVIRGPGASVWGANAVNGVINITTKSAKDTHGAYAELGGGDQERGFVGMRVGNVTANGVHWRVTGKWFDRNRQFEPAGRSFDDWRQGRVGFRSDWQSSDSDKITFQADYYNGVSGNTSTQAPFGLVAEDAPVSGGNALVRWTRDLGEQSDASLQMYYDRTDRRTISLDQNINIFDLDFVHRFPWDEYQKIVWGVGYRRTWDNLPTARTPAQFAVFPTTRTMETASAFVQNEMTLIEDRFYSTIGTKISDNALTDFEIQPSARLLWTPSRSSVVWSSVSRAVRTPSRIEHDGLLVIGQVPPPAPSGVPLVLRGRRNVDSEELMAYEVGFRQQATEYLSWDVAVFYNVYEKLHALRPTPGSPVPPTFDIFNGESGHGYGVELSADLLMSSWWSLSGHYSHLRLDIESDPDSFASPNVIAEANPRHQVFLMSSFDIGCNVELDIIGRYVDRISSLNIPKYFTMDTRLAWRPSDSFELSIVGQNLLDATHPEYSSSIFSGEVPTEVRRGVYGMVRLNY